MNGLVTNTDKNMIIKPKFEKNEGLDEDFIL
jgi:hypothetical protein